MELIKWSEIAKDINYGDLSEEELISVFTKPQDTDDVVAAAELFGAAIKNLLSERNINADVFHFVECDFVDSRCEVHFVVVDKNTGKCLTYSKSPAPVGSWCIDLMQVGSIDDVNAELAAALSYILANA